VAPPPQPKPGSSSQQDRKVPPPIGTERLARIRQTGSVNPPLLTTSYTASVGQGGIWSFGVGSASGEREEEREDIVDVLQKLQLVLFISAGIS